jgi:uncharacterized protein with HEPN domain
MPRDVTIVLDEMLETITKLQTATDGKTIEYLAADWFFRMGVERAIEILSEASRHLPEELLAHEPQIPWKRVHSMGNVLRHEYHRIAEDVIWDVLTHDLPPLKLALLRLRSRF